MSYMVRLVSHDTEYHLRPAVAYYVDVDVSGETHHNRLQTHRVFTSGYRTKFRYSLGIAVCHTLYIAAQADSLTRHLDTQRAHREFVGKVYTCRHAPALYLPPSMEYGIDVLAARYAAIDVGRRLIDKSLGSEIADIVCEHLLHHHKHLVLRGVLMYQ